MKYRPTPGPSLLNQPSIVPEFKGLKQSPNKYYKFDICLDFPLFNDIELTDILTTIYKEWKETLTTAKKA